MFDKAFFNYLVIMYLFCFSELFSQEISLNWEEINPGIDIVQLNSTHSENIIDSSITIIRINPHLYKIKLLSSKELKTQNKSVVKWAKEYDLFAAINAGMYQMDFNSNVGYMKNYSYFNNATKHSEYQSVAAFNPKDTALAPFKIFDLDEHEFDNIIENYNTVIQNLRLIKKKGENRWTPKKRKWSEAALGEDINGNVLLIFSRAPYTMHDLNNILLSVPINLVAAQHLEGGPEASLYFNFNGKQIKNLGSYETGFNENNRNINYWPIPNVIGFSEK